VISAPLSFIYRRFQILASTPNVIFGIFNCQNYFMGKWPILTPRHTTHFKSEFSTKEGAEHRAIELKRRFPMLQICIYDPGTQSRHDLPA